MIYHSIILLEMALEDWISEYFQIFVHNAESEAYFSCNILHDQSDSIASLFINAFESYALKWIFAFFQAAVAT